MCKKEKLFYINAREPYIDEDERAFFGGKNIRFIHQSNIIFEYLPTIINRTECFHGVDDSTVVFPKKDIPTVMIPIDPQLLGEYLFKDYALHDVVSSFIKKYFSGNIFLASADPNYCIFCHIKDFEHQILVSLQSGNATTPFFIFDEDMTSCFGFDYDFEICFLSSKKLYDGDPILHGSFEEWDRFFIEEFSERFHPETTHQHYFENYILPNVPRMYDIYSD